MKEAKEGGSAMGDDLNDMLLAAAGRRKSSSNHTSKPRDGKKQRAPVRSSSSEEDEEDYGDRKGSKMPLKKRFDSGDRDEAYESDLSFGSDLYRDEEDKMKLNALSELEREMELHDRSERLDNYKMRKGAEQKISAKEQQQSQRAAASSRARSSGREASSKKATALHELVAKRQKAQDTDQRKRAAAAASGRRSATPSSNTEGDSEDEGESSRESNRSDPLPTDDEEDERYSRDLPDNEDIKQITIRRSYLFKWFMEPFFEETIVGCFVRIGIGVSSSGNRIYRVCFVKSVDAKDPEKQYKFENRVTHKYLNCTWGDESTAARWQMVRASDQAPTDEEIKEWKAEVIKSGDFGVTKTQVKKKVEALQKISSFVYSAAAVKLMLQEKKMATATKVSTVAHDKEKLLKELNLAESRGDQEQVERLQEKLRELESHSLKQQTKNEKAERIEMMNRRNRFENFKNASELKPVNSAAKIGEVGYDPFSRRWTRSQNYYKSDAPKTAADQNEGGSLDKAAKDLETLHDPSKQANARLGGSQQHSKMFNLHDFDLPISLAAIDRFKGGQGAAAAFMERKRNIEARYGVCVGSNDSRRHTLTVNDYKRRRGLL